MFIWVTVTPFSKTKIKNCSSSVLWTSGLQWEGKSQNNQLTSLLFSLQMKCSIFQMQHTMPIVFFSNYIYFIADGMLVVKNQSNIECQLFPRRFDRHKDSVTNTMHPIPVLETILYLRIRHCIRKYKCDISTLTKGN